MTRTVHHIPGLELTDREHEVPLDHGRPDGGRIRVFAREVRAVDRPRDLPYLVFLQGGPGFASPRPMERDGWLRRATEEYRVLLLDQRGTGRSTPVNAQTLEQLGDAAAQARYLKLFRADSIVQDAECIREELLGPGSRWSVLGQSFGGFCATNYLSTAPDSLSAVFITGGLPPLAASADDVYRLTYPMVLAKNRAYYERYPDDVERQRAIVGALEGSDVRLPSGDRLTARRFQQLGLLLGFSDGFETIHYLVEEAFVPGTDGLSYPFLRGFENALHYDTNPIFSVLHEACYAQGAATNWAAERLRAGYPELDAATDSPVYFTGEMIYPWMFDEIGALRPFKEVAELLAQDAGWPPLYDAAVLARNEVRCAASVYVDDMYVHRDPSLATAAGIQGLRVWLTNEHEHNGLRAAGEAVLSQLMDLVTGRR